MAKALSGGYVPVGAMLTTDKIYSSVYSSMDKLMKHSTTFKGGPLAMAAGLAALAVIDDEGLVENAARRGEELMRSFRELQAKYDLIKDVRGKGLIIGLEFGRPSGLKARTNWAMLQKARVGLFAQMVVVALFQRHRILTQVSGDHMEVIKLIPPLMISDTEVKLFTDGLRRGHGGRQQGQRADVGLRPDTGQAGDQELAGLSQLAELADPLGSQPQGRGDGFVRDHLADRAVAVTAVLGPVGRIDLAPQLARPRSDVLDHDVRLQAGDPDPGPAHVQDPAEPSGRAPVPGPHVHLVTGAHDPDRYELGRRPVGAPAGDLQLVGPVDLLQLFRRPGRGHGRFAPRPAGPGRWPGRADR